LWTERRIRRKVAGTIGIDPDDVVEVAGEGLGRLAS
jgi:hypothetical protein